jgi:hypothetical protein
MKTQETISEYYNIEPKTYKHYHMLMLLCNNLIKDKKDSDFWISKIKEEINNNK